MIGLASPANHEWLAGHGVIPVAYGDGAAARIRQAAGKVDAFIDTFGADYVQLALGLGVEPSRIDTIVRFDAVAEYGIKAEGNAAGAARARWPTWPGWSQTARWRCRSPRRSRSARSRTPTVSWRAATSAGRSS